MHLAATQAPDPHVCRHLDHSLGRRRRLPSRDPELYAHDGRSILPRLYGGGRLACVRPHDVLLL